MVIESVTRTVHTDVMNCNSYFQPSYGDYWGPKDCLLLVPPQVRINVLELGGFKTKSK